MKKKYNQKKIVDDYGRRERYFTKRPEAVEFVKPKKFLDKNNSPYFFSLDEPYMTLSDGSFGNPNVYYFDKEEYNELTRLFREFKLPDEHIPDLTFAYLNMCLSACTVLHGEDVSATLKRRNKELYDTIDILDEIVAGKRNIISFTLQTKGGEKYPKIFTVKRSKTTIAEKFISDLALEFLVGTFKKFKDTEDYRIHKPFYELYKNNEASRVNSIAKKLGYKNELTYKQSSYAVSIAKYFGTELFKAASELRWKYRVSGSKEDFEKYKVCRRELFKLYPKNKGYLLIGKMMVLANLLSQDEDETVSDEKLIDKIKKKIQPPKIMKKQEAK